MKIVVLDAGALISLERGDRMARAWVLLAERGDLSLVTSSGVIAQVWRGGSRQARLSKLLASELVAERPLDRNASRRVGALAALQGTSDVVDGHVALLALDEDGVVLTSDDGDIAAWGIDRAKIVHC